VIKIFIREKMVSRAGVLISSFVGSGAIILLRGGIALVGTESKIFIWGGGLRNGLEVNLNTVNSFMGLGVQASEVENAYREVGKEPVQGTVGIRRWTEKRLGDSRQRRGKTRPV